MRVAGCTALVLAVLSLTGHLLWPQQVPGPSPDLPALPSPEPLPAVPDLAEPVRTEPLLLDAPGGRLPGLVVEPVAAAGPEGRPGVVLVHDKRTAGYGPLHRDYAALAADTLAAVALLRDRPGVAPDRVGVLGVSEGGWVAPIAAADGGADFVVLAAAPTVSPGEQLQWLLDGGLADQGAPSGARAALASAQATPLPGGVLGYTRHDPQPPLQALDHPVLAVYGTADPAIPVVDSARRLLADTGPATTVHLLAGADHGLRLPGGALSPDYLPAVGAWVRGLPATAEPAPGTQVRGTAAVQRHPAGPQPAAPLGGGGLLVGALVLVAAGALAGPVAMRWTRRRRAPGLPPDAWAPVRRRVSALRWGAVGGTAAINVGLAGLAATAVLGGGPPATGGLWLLVRASGVGVVVLGVRAALAMPATAGGARPSTAQRIAWAGSLVAGGAAAVLAARIGAFSVGW